MPYQDPQQPYQQPVQPQQPYQQQPTQVNVNVQAQVPPQQQGGRPVLYFVSEQDKNLRLAAFVFMLLSLLATCWLLIPLCWTIPMTIASWRIYKGTSGNSTAFAVCSLLFVSLIAGILLLISKKDK